MRDERLMRVFLAVLVSSAGLTALACSDTAPSAQSEATTASPAPATGVGAAGDGSSGSAMALPAETGAAAPAATASGAASESAAPAGPADVDYAVPSHWLCRPDNNAACEVDIATTVVQADGTTAPEPFAAAAAPPIDCFYVYPTVSLDPTPNSDLVPGAEEQSVVRRQLARFASQCRLFAPMYRQVTLTALRTSLTGGDSMADATLGYQDVLAAFRYYMEHDNAGRGVVLIGHSQGSRVLMQLIHDELDRPALDPRFVGGLVIGMNVTVPMGQLVGGSFQHVPLCTSAEQLGCIVAYASFRANQPPPEGSLFGFAEDPTQMVACTNPAALGGGKGELQAYLSADGAGASSMPMGEWVTGGAPVATPFVSVPGLLSAECVASGGASYLAITINGVPADPRTDDIVADVYTNGVVQANWGLHLVDINLAQGNLVQIVAAKAQAHLAR